MCSHIRHMHSGDRDRIGIRAPLVLCMHALGQRSDESILPLFFGPKLTRSKVKSAMVHEFNATLVDTRLRVSV